MIYILGTTHDIMNHEEDNDSLMNEYYNFIKDQIQEKSFKITAEESV